MTAAELRALPPWYPWDSAEDAIASLRAELQRQRNTVAELRAALSQAREEGARLRQGRIAGQLRKAIALAGTAPLELARDLERELVR